MRSIIEKFSKEMKGALCFVVLCFTIFPGQLCAQFINPGITLPLYRAYDLNNFNDDVGNDSALFSRSGLWHHSTGSNCMGKSGCFRFADHQSLTYHTGSRVEGGLVTKPYYIKAVSILSVTEWIETENHPNYDRRRITAGCGSDAFVLFDEYGSDPHWRTQIITIPSEMDGRNVSFFIQFRLNLIPMQTGMEDGLLINFTWLTLPFLIWMVTV